MHKAGLFVLKGVLLIASVYFLQPIGGKIVAELSGGKLCWCMLVLESNAKEISCALDLQFHLI